MAGGVTKCAVAQGVCAVGGAGGSNRRELCQHFGIAPKTGYKWLVRYAQAGASGLEDRSKRPRRSPARTATECNRRWSGCGANRATRWGGRKLSRGCRVPRRSGAGARARDWHSAPRRGCSTRRPRPGQRPFQRFNVRHPTNCGRWTSRATSPCSAAAAAIRSPCSTRQFRSWLRASRLAPMSAARPCAACSPARFAATVCRPQS